MFYDLTKCSSAFFKAALHFWSLGSSRNKFSVGYSPQRYWKHCNMLFQISANNGIYLELCFSHLVNINPLLTLERSC